MSKSNQKKCVPVEWTSQVFPLLAAKVAKYTIQGEPDECWKWSRSHYAGGYGQVNLPRSEFPGRRTHQTPVSRVLMHLRAGRELNLKDEFACHTCDNRWCCNPAHLYIGSCSDNNADRAERNPRTCEKHPLVKLTSAEVTSIRESYAEGIATQYELAAQFGVSQPSISLIVRHINWSTQEY